MSLALRTRVSPCWSIPFGGGGSLGSGHWVAGLSVGLGSGGLDDEDGRKPMSIMIEWVAGGRDEEIRKYEFLPEGGGLRLWNEDGSWEIFPWHRIHGIHSVKSSE